jgi:hypothetical protein
MAAQLGGCIVEDDWCGPHQVRDKENHSICRCAPDAVLSANGYSCEPCGENESVATGKCECIAGYARAAAGSPCVKSTTSAVGDPCSDALPCTEPNPYCATVEGESFCTKPGGCTANADCPPNTVCHRQGDMRFCGSVPGLAQVCGSQAECTGTQATYCETYSAKVCLPQGCVADPASCPSAWVCCDLTRFIQTSICIPAASLALREGTCVDGSEPVKP